MSLGTTFAVERREAVVPAPVAKPSKGNGPARPPRFSRNEIIERIREWALLYGEPPTIRDWDPSRARRTGQIWRAERFEAGDRPRHGQAPVRQVQRGGAGSRLGATAGSPQGQAPSCGTGAGDRSDRRVDQALRRTTNAGGLGYGAGASIWPGLAHRSVRERRLAQPELGSVPLRVSRRSDPGGRPPATPGRRPSRCDDRVARAQPTSGSRDRCRPDIALRWSSSRRAGAGGGTARRSADPQRLRMALLGVASVAIRWASDIAWNGAD